MALHTITAAKSTDKYPDASKKLAAVLTKLLGIKPSVENLEGAEDERYQSYYFASKPTLSTLDFLKKTLTVADYLGKHYDLDDLTDVLIYVDEPNSLLVYLSADLRDKTTCWVKVIRG